MVAHSKPLEVHSTAIPGLLVADLPVHGDARGWFKENWQREKMVAAGLPDFRPVQQNISFNAAPGVTRGLHAEPWDKFVSVATGKVFGVWVDLRAGDSFGTVVEHEIDPSVAVFVPRGVANGFQTLEANTAYVYLVNAHWSPDARYTEVSLFDERLGIAWPIPRKHAVVSDKDTKNPLLESVTPVPPRRTMIVGAKGQVGQALQALYPDADLVTRGDFDITDEQAVRQARQWSEYGTIINAAAYTKVDQAETEAGRRQAWLVNDQAVANLAQVADEHDITLVHISSDCVFDGTVEYHHENEPLSPLGVYGQSKAAGDRAATRAHRHYVVRTSWVVGDGINFVRTMQALAIKGICPKVVNDQHGRLTFASTLAQAIRHLLDVEAPYGTYHVSNAGSVASWAEVAQQVFSLSGYSASDVTPVTTEEYSRGKEFYARRPKFSTLCLDKLEDTGFVPTPWEQELAHYLTGS